MSFISSVAAVWLRHFAVFKKNIWYGVVTTFVEPVLYLASFGFGLGTVIGRIQADGHSVSYRAFVLAGLIGQSILFTSFFDGAYGGFIRMYYQKIFQAIAVTPITLGEVLWGELLWCATRGALSATVILGIGLVLGDFSAGGVLALIPVIGIGALFFAALGMLVAANSRTIESISYPQYLFIFPMFLFCGVYFPLTQLPEWAQSFTRVLPLTAFLSVTRWLVLGFRFEGWALPVLLGWTVAFVPWAHSQMKNRVIH